MDVAQLLALMVCVPCGASSFRITDNHRATCGNCGTAVELFGRSVLVKGTSEVASDDWADKQAASVARYSHETYNAEEEPVLKLFGGFMAVTLDRDAKVVDVGCGLTPTLPGYVDELGLSNYLGLEPLTDPVARDFPCIVGAVAEKMPLQTDSMDAAIFATSQDHIVGIDQAMSEARRVVRPGGSMFMWIGLYEPEMMAWAKSFHNLTHKGGIGKRIARTIAPLDSVKLAWAMWRRQRALASGKRLDGVHERWYTLPTVIASLERWGLKADRMVVPPGVPGVFVEAIN